MTTTLQSRGWTTALAMAAVLLLTAPMARAAAPLATVSVSPQGLEWQPAGDFEKFTLTVSGPGGVTLRREIQNGAPLAFEPLGDDGKPLADGTYAYELTATPRLDAATRQALAAAHRSGDEAAIAKLQTAGKLPRGPLAQSGFFTIHNGALLSPDAKEGRPAPRATKALTPLVLKDVVTADDAIIQGSLCVGLDCVNNESFGFDTIRLKENNTRIKFEDTSTGTGFPTHDWQLTANDSASGGAEKFSIEDITAATVPFTVSGSAPTNSIFVDSTGRLGLRTATPVLDIHVATSNTPAMRLEQNNSGGFTAQTWDVGGNEANFFVRDVTGGSRLPFRIRPGAPTSSIDINASGSVGIGTASPSQKMEIRQDTDANLIAVITNTNTGLTANAVWRAASDTTQMNMLSHSSTRTATRFGQSLGGASEIFSTGGTKMLFGTLETDSLFFGTNNTTRLTIDGSTGAATFSGNVTVNGTFSNPSSRELKEAFVPVDPSIALKKFAMLPINEWSYKNDDRKLRHVGPTVEDFQNAFGLGTEGRYIFPMDVQGVTMAAVQGLYKLVQEKDSQIAELRKEMQEIKQLLEKVNKQ
jgi:hypothetical protein